MTNLTFSRAQSVTVSIPYQRKLDVAYDAKLNFNTTIAQWDNKQDSSMYSLDPVGILDLLEKDDIAPLTKITIGCQVRKDSTLVWDVFFNLLYQKNLLSCVFVCDKDYLPINKSRVKTHSQFLNLNKGVSRLQENALEIGDRVGMSIFNEVTQTTFVLLYSITGQCLAQHLKTEESDRKSRTTGLNLNLDHVYSINQDNSAIRLDIDEESDIHDNAQFFVEWIATCVNNQRLVYPWKPHFLPAAPRPFVVDKIEKSMRDTIDLAEPISYDEFEDICRDAYNKIRNKRSANNSTKNTGDKNKDGDKQKKTYSVYEVPVVEIVDLDSSGKFFGRIEGGDGRCFIFHAPEDYTTLMTESFLFNKDLKDKILTETSGIFVTTNVSEGKRYILRYLTINF